MRRPGRLARTALVVLAVAAIGAGLMQAWTAPANVAAWMQLAAFCQ